MVNLYGEHDLLVEVNGADYRYGSIPGNNVVHASISIVGDSSLGNDDDDDDGTQTRATPQCLLTTVDTDNHNNLLLLRGEMAGMANLAAPVVLTYFLEMLPGIVTLILVGHTTTTEMAYDGSGGDTDTNDEYELVEDNIRKLRLDAASLAVMFTNVVALSPAYGECNMKYYDGATSSALCKCIFHALSTLLFICLCRSTLITVSFSLALSNAHA
jgi:hypothetical protein